MLVKVNFLTLSSIITDYTTAGQSGSLLKCDFVNTCCFLMRKHTCYKPWLPVIGLKIFVILL